MEETPLPTKRAERKALKAPKLRSSDLVRRNLIHLFDSMAERPCFDYFDRLQAQEPHDKKGREECLKGRIAALFKELQETASVAKDQERLLARYRALVSEVLEKLADDQVAEALAMIIRFQDGRRV